MALVNCVLIISISQRTWSFWKWNSDLESPRSRNLFFSYHFFCWLLKALTIGCLFHFFEYAASIIFKMWFTNFEMKVFAFHGHLFHPTHFRMLTPTQMQQIYGEPFETLPNSWHPSDHLSPVPGKNTTYPEEVEQVAIQGNPARLKPERIYMDL